LVVIFFLLLTGCILYFFPQKDYQPPPSATTDDQPFRLSPEWILVFASYGALYMVHDKKPKDADGTLFDVTLSCNRHRRANDDFVEPRTVAPPHLLSSGCDKELC
jgi:hypothetical protein